MKKTYQMPEADVITFDARDIITTSYIEDNPSDINSINVGNFFG